MIKATLFLGLLSLVLASVFAADLAEEVKSYRKCPCKCFTGYRVKRAIRQCKRAIFSYQCIVKDCKVHYKAGKECCDRALPSTTSTATATPTPTSSPKVSCPCTCGKRGAARAMCRYKPYCEVTKCPEEDDHHHAPHGYYKPKFQCCDKASYPPKH